MICINHLRKFVDSLVERSAYFIHSFVTIFFEPSDLTRFNGLSIFAEDHFVIPAHLSIDSRVFPENFTRKNSIFFIKFRVDKILSGRKLLFVVCL